MHRTGVTELVSVFLLLSEEDHDASNAVCCCIHNVLERIYLLRRGNTQGSTQGTLETSNDAFLRVSRCD